MRRIFFLALLAAGAACTYVRPVVPECRSFEKVTRSGNRGLINPLLDIEPQSDFAELRPFQRKLEHFVDKRKSAADIHHVSVYFRDLNDGPLFTIHATEKFIPASLLKVPLMLAVFKQAEEYPLFLNTKVRYEPQPDWTPSVATATLRPGGSYTIEQLVRAMIVDSDNGAAMLLDANIDPTSRERLYSDLGLSTEFVPNVDPEITVGEFATFFRVLYNASYLNQAHSQKALEYLSASEFSQGIKAGVPPEITVAHKFGERYNLSNKLRQLHDCGIVYYPPSPYILCVMTRDEDFAVQAELIRDVSKAVYDEVSSQTKPSSR